MAEEIPASLKRLMEEQHYKIVGRHSGVKICHWTKQSLRGRGVCYKQKFYGVECHRCLQMSPALAWCTNRCVMCWRSVDNGLGGSISVPLDDPGKIVDGSIEAQRLLLSGFKGFGGVDMRKWKEAQEPNNVAISLVGEPTLYPMLSGLISEFKDRGFSVFLVTNGQLPDALEALDPLPTQLYISLDAPDRESYMEVDRPSMKDSWDRLSRSLGIMSSMGCRRVVRLTLIKGWNMQDISGYARMIEKAGPNYVEAKGYVHVGQSQQRLDRETMPSHAEIRDFSASLAEELGWRMADESEPSRVVLLRP